MVICLGRSDLPIDRKVSYPFNMSDTYGFVPGDFLAFQLESGFGLIRVLAIGSDGGQTVWHVRGYSDLFLDIESAEAQALHGSLSVAIDHVALTERAFESTQVSRLANQELTSDLVSLVQQWEKNPERTISDRSVRLHLGLR